MRRAVAAPGVRGRGSNVRQGRADPVRSAASLVASQIMRKQYNTGASVQTPNELSNERGEMLKQLLGCDDKVKLVRVVCDEVISVKPDNMNMHLIT